MPDKTFDAIIIGGGNKGLVTGMYLAKYGGMDVAIFEKRHEIGGGWSSEESTAPGFITDTHATALAQFYHEPIMTWDFPDFAEKGGAWTPYEVAHGSIFSEDQSSICFYGEASDPDQHKTAAQIGRFSNKDADTWLQWWKKFQQTIKPAFYKTLFNPVPAGDAPDAIESAYREPALGIDPLWYVCSPVALLRDMFESTELHAHLLRTVFAWSGNQPVDNNASALSQFLGNFLFSQYGHAEAGTHSWAHACHKIYLEHGGKSFTRHPVSTVIIDNGRARGVRLSNGVEVAARKLVVSTLDPASLCFELIGEDFFNAKTLRRIRNLSKKLITITWYHWAVHELPHYLASETNPAMAKTAHLNLITKDPEALIRETCWRKLGKMPPELNLMVWCHSRGDRKRAPGEKHICGSEQFVLGADALTEEQWRTFKRRHAEDVIAHWQRYAPNMAWENIIAYDPLTPFDCLRLPNMGPTGNWAVIDNTPDQTGRFRPVPELAHHRTPVGGLYATGSAWPFTGAAIMAQAYNCYKVIAEDFDVQRPWEADGRPF